MAAPSNHAQKTRINFTDQYEAIQQEVAAINAQKRADRNVLRDYRWIYTYPEPQRLYALLVRIMRLMADTLMDFADQTDISKYQKDDTLIEPLSQREFFGRLFRYIYDISVCTHQALVKKTIAEVESPSFELNMSRLSLKVVAMDIVKYYNMFTKTGRGQLYSALIYYSDDVDETQTFKTRLGDLLYTVINLMSFNTPRRTSSVKTSADAAMSRAKLYKSIYELFNANRQRILRYAYQHMPTLSPAEQIEYDQILETLSTATEISSEMEVEKAIENMCTTALRYVKAFKDLQHLLPIIRAEPSLAEFIEKLDGACTQLSEVEEDEEDIDKNPWCLTTKAPSNGGTKRQSRPAASRSRSKKPAEDEADEDDAPDTPSKQPSSSSSSASDGTPASKISDLHWKDIAQLISASNKTSSVKQTVTEHVQSEILRHMNKICTPGTDKWKTIEDMFVNKTELRKKDPKEAKKCEYDQEILEQTYDETTLFLYPSSEYVRIPLPSTSHDKPQYEYKCVYVVLMVYLKPSEQDANKMVISKFSIQDTRRMPVIFLKTGSTNTTAISRYIITKASQSDRKKAVKTRSFKGFTVHCYQEKDKLPKWMEDAREYLETQVQQLSTQIAKHLKLSAQRLIQFVFPDDARRKDVILNKTHQPTAFLPHEYIEIESEPNKVFVPSTTRCVVRRITANQSIVHRLFIAWDRNANAPLPASQYGAFGYFLTPQIFKFFSDAQKDVDVITVALMKMHNFAKSLPKGNVLPSFTAQDDEPNVTITSSSSTTITPIEAYKCQLCNKNAAKTQPSTAHDDGEELSTAYDDGEDDDVPVMRHLDRIDTSSDDEAGSDVNEIVNVFEPPPKRKQAKKTANIEDAFF